MFMVLQLWGCSESPSSGGQGDIPGPLYALSNTLLSTDAPTSYLPVVRSLDAAPPFLFSTT
jgi:hypothetical protein